MKHIFLSLNISRPGLVNARLFFKYYYKIHNVKYIMYNTLERHRSLTGFLSGKFTEMLFLQLQWPKDSTGMWESNFGLF